MGWKTFFSILFILIVIILLVFYWFYPFKYSEFTPKSENVNFSITGQEMQFYEKMRFSDKEISYNIHNCPLQKENDMQKAFDIVSNTTILKFYQVNENEEISVSCEDSIRTDKEPGLFIAGEGGPVNITKTRLFNVILKGEILLIKESSCPKPEIAIHELFHVLGFKHSDNKDNIMYPVSSCNQEISQDIVELIANLYSYDNLPDLAFENVSAQMNGRYLESNINIINQGLKLSGKSELMIYSDDKLIKKIEIDRLDIGHMLKISLKNLWVSDFNTKEIKFYINSSSDELNKENNQIILEVKN